MDDNKESFFSSLKNNHYETMKVLFVYFFLSLIATKHKKGVLNVISENEQGGSLHGLQRHLKGFDQCKLLQCFKGLLVLTAR